MRKDFNSKLGVMNHTKMLYEIIVHDCRVIARPFSRFVQDQPSTQSCIENWDPGFTNWVCCSVDFPSSSWSLGWGSQLANAESFRRWIRKRTKKDNHTRRTNCKKTGNARLIVMTISKAVDGPRFRSYLAWNMFLLYRRWVGKWNRLARCSTCSSGNEYCRFNLAVL